MRLLTILVAILLLPLALVAQDYRVFYIDASQPPVLPVLSEDLPQRYNFPDSSVAADVTLRDVFFANPVRLTLTNLIPHAKYKLRMSFLSEQPRTQSIKVGSTVLEKDLVLPQGKILEKEWTIPVAAYSGENLPIVLEVIKGPNAVVQKVEVFSDNPQKLELKSTHDRLAIEAVSILPPRISPRPVTVAGVANPMLSLNGTWRFSPEGNAGPESQPIKVPGEWATQGFAVPKGEFAEYYHTFDVPSDWSGKNIRLRFDSVHAVCKVFINAVEIGGHEGGFVPFELDATKGIKPGVQNVIRVKVQCESNPDDVACLSKYAAHQVGGILRKVTLFALPRTNLAGQIWTVSFDENFKDVVLTVNNAIQVKKGDGLIYLDYELVDASGAVVSRFNTKENYGIINSSQTADFQTLQTEFSWNIASPLHWTSETPNLYTLKTTLSVNGVAVQTIHQRIGFRQIEVKGNILLINGKPVKLFGVNRHEVYPLGGRSITPELCRRDVELFRDGNCNLIRTSHYPPSEELLDYCDEMGMFVDAEAALCWVGRYDGVSSDWNQADPQKIPYLLRPSLDNVTAYRGHPSVIMWSLANESNWTPMFARVNRIIQALDPSRPTIFHDNTGASNEADIAVMHYPGPNNSQNWSQRHNPLFFGEFVHIQCYNRHELVTDPFVRVDWARPTARMIDLIWEQPGCLGGAIWCGIDDVFHLPGNELRGYGHWGVIDAWRRKKPEWFGMKKAFTPVRICDAAKARKVENGVVKLEIQNRFNYTNLKDVKIVWQCEGRSGVIAADIAPHAKGELVIPVGSVGDNAKLEISATDLRGVICENEIISLNETPTGFAQPSVDASAKYVESQDGFAWQDKAAKTKLTLDKKTGSIRGTVGGTELVNGPIELMVLPLNGADGSTTRKLVNVIAPFTDVCKNRVPGRVAPSSDNPHAVTIEDTYDEAEGSITLEPVTANTVRVSYQYTLRKEINPRQWGLVFTLPRELDTLIWNSRGLWTNGPADDIGRPSGMAKANPRQSDEVEELYKDMSELPWYQDSNKLGTNDFRSTKAHIYTATLSTNPEGTHAFTVKSDGSACTRTWVDGNNVKLLVTGFNTGGADRFFNSHYGAERRPLKKGDSIQGTFEIQL
ncbi:MAG: hypothetical protein LBV12_10395, partial [Puniceicoccales bacterium]|nr:hypothetical protein [Puniceicoccales bacterium]